MRRRVELRIAQAESLVVAKEEMAAAAAVALTPQTPLKAMSAAVRRMERATALLQQPVASAAPFASAAPAEESCGAAPAEESGVSCAAAADAPAADAQAAPLTRRPQRPTAAR